MPDDGAPAYRYRMAEYATIDPWVISADTLAEIAFLTEVFGGVARAEPMLDGNGRVAHAEIAIGESVVMLFDSRETRPAYLRIYVDDVDAVLSRAQSRGARVVTRPTELAWGDVVCRFRDPQGHLWWVFQKLDIDVAEMERRAQDPRFQEAMEYVRSSAADDLA